MTVPTALDQVIATGLAKQPGDRYRSTVEMAAAARNAITDPVGNSSPRQPVPSDSAQTHHRQTTDGIPPPAGTQFRHLSSRPTRRSRHRRSSPRTLCRHRRSPRDILRRQPARHRDGAAPS